MSPIHEYLPKSLPILCCQYHFSVELVIDEHPHLEASIWVLYLPFSLNFTLCIHTLAVSAVNTIVSAKAFVTIVSKATPISIATCHAELSFTMTLVLNQFTYVYLFGPSTYPSSFACDIGFAPMPSLKQLAVCFDYLDAFAKYLIGVVDSNLTIVNKGIVLNDTKLIDGVLALSKLLFSEIIEGLLFEQVN